MDSQAADSKQEETPKPATVIGKIAFLLNSGSAGFKSGKHESRRKKPSTVVGAVAYVFGTRKSVVRDWGRACIVVTLIVGTAYLLKRNRTANDDYWEDIRTTQNDDKMMALYGPRAQRVFSTLSEDRKQKVRTRIRKKLDENPTVRKRARKVYDGLSAKDKREVRKILGK